MKNHILQPKLFVKLMFLQSYNLWADSVFSQQLNLQTSFNVKSTQCMLFLCSSLVIADLHMLSGAERGSKPRASALHVVCCMETLYVSLRDATNKMFLNPTLRPTPLYTRPNKQPLYIIFQVLRSAQNLQRCARLSLF